MVRSPHACVLLALACIAWSGQPLAAQTKKKGDAIVGTVVSIEKAKTGRSHTLKMKTKSDEEYEVPIVPKTQLVVEVRGEAGFLQPNTVVGGLIFPGNTPGEFDCAELIAYLTNPPQPLFKPSNDPDQPDAVEIVGRVVNLQQGVVQIQCGQQTIRLGRTDTLLVTVKHGDATQIKEGDAVEVEGTIVKSKNQINANTVHVTVTGSIKADDFFAAQGGKSTKTAMTKGKAKNAAGATTSKEADPFGVLNGAAKAQTKSKTKSKTGSAATGPGMKEADPFGVLNNGQAKSKVKSKTGTAIPPANFKESDPFGVQNGKSKVKAKADSGNSDKKEAEVEKPAKKSTTTTKASKDEPEKSESKE